MSLGPPDLRQAAHSDETEPSLVLSSIVFAVLSCVSCALVFLVALPWAAGRWARAIRVRDRPAGVSFGPPSAAGITSAGLAVVLVGHLPVLLALRAAYSVDHAEPLAALDVIGALGFTSLVAALFLRLPLVLVEGPQRGSAALVRAMARSAVTAVSFPLETLLVTTVHVGASAIVVVVGAYVNHVSRSSFPWVMLVGGFALALVWTGSLMLTSRLTPAGITATRRETLKRIAAVLLVPLGALILAGALATREARELTVVHDADLYVPADRRQVRVAPGVRGRFEHEGFLVRGTVRGVRIEPAHGEAYEILGRYGGDIALLTETPCGTMRRMAEPSCVRVQMDGLRSTMAIELDATGRRLDDGVLDRALERLGTSGSVAISLGVLALGLSWFLLAWIARSARRLAGGGRHHRLAGRLQLGADGWLGTEGRIRGGDNRVTLLEGGATLRLPADLMPLAVAPDRRDAIDGADVLVATDEPPALATHRSAETPWPKSAELVVGEPAKIEAEALASAETQIVRAVLVGVIASLCALGLLTFA